jgi:hypothetical protein
MYASADNKDSSDDNSDPLLQGNVTVNYAVSTRGRATDLKLVEAQPPEFESMVNTVQRELRSRVFRPRLEEGDVVETPDITLAHRFYYRQSDLDALRAEQAASEQR